MLKTKLVNKGIPKVDGFSLTRGAPVFAYDYEMPGMLYVALLRSPHAHARIKTIDTSKAESLNGVECVITSKDVPKRVPHTRAGQGYPEPSPYDTFLLDTKVRYVGDVVAVVAACSYDVAKEALGLIDVEYEVLPHIVDFENAEAMSERCIIHDEEDSSGIYDPVHNICAYYSMSVGDIKKELENADVVVEFESLYPKTQHVALEPHCALTYLTPEGRLIVVSSTQVPFHVRRILSKILDLPPGKVRVIKPKIGSGFGSKQGVLIEPYPALVTLKTGKPAKLVLSREEVFIGTYTRHSMKFNVKIGATKEGIIKAIKLEGLSDTGAYGDHALTTIMVSGSKTLPLYNKTNALSFKGKVVYSNKPVAGAFRGYGATQAFLALETAVNILAEKLNMDPCNIRLKNVIDKGESSEVFKIMGEGKEGVEQVLRSCLIKQCITEGKKMFRWDERRRHAGYDKTLNAYRGCGMAIAMQGSGIPKIDMASATIKLNDDGSFNLLVGATDLGTGSDTVLSQIAAEVLGVDISDIIITSSDTDVTPFDTGAYASSTTYVSGNAVFKAATQMKEEIIKAAAEYFGVKPEDVVFEDKMLKTKTDSISLKDLATLLFYTFNQRQLCCTASFVGEESPIPFVAGFAEVVIDADTGYWNVTDFLVVVDCGVPINPVLAEGQIKGAIAQGIGAVMHEELLFDDKGKCLNASLFRYKVPSKLEVPDIKVVFLKEPEPTGPFGAKSVSEVAINLPAPVLIEAIYNAIGVRFNKIPIKPEDIWEKALSKKLTIK